MQLLAKFEKILYMGFRATLNFRKFKVMSYHHPCLGPVYNKVTLVRKKKNG